jgi:hypothetical protein
MFALLLGANQPDKVRKLIVHEVALSGPLNVDQPADGSPGRSPDSLFRLTTLSDEEIPAACKRIFRTANENPEAWDALGESHHKRLERNYVRWVRVYIGSTVQLRPLTVKESQRRPGTSLLLR